jgi:hypothetical protein
MSKVASHLVQRWQISTLKSKQLLTSHCGAGAVVCNIWASITDRDRELSVSRLVCQWRVAAAQWRAIAAMQSIMNQASNMQQLAYSMQQKLHDLTSNAMGRALYRWASSYVSVLMSTLVARWVTKSQVHVSQLLREKHERSAAVASSLSRQCTDLTSKLSAANESLQMADDERDKLNAAVIQSDEEQQLLREALIEVEQDKIVLQQALLKADQVLESEQTRAKGRPLAVSPSGGEDLSQSNAHRNHQMSPGKKDRTTRAKEVVTIGARILKRLERRLRQQVFRKLVGEWHAQYASNCLIRQAIQVCMQ